MTELYSNSIFWIEVDKIRPNPYQPRREFDEARLADLGESIRQYGVLQPLVVTRHEIPRYDGGMVVEYELIAGERRLRAAKLVGVQQVPVVIRTGEDDSKMKLELAIIENLQREDLNPVDRAKAFQRFIDEFSYKHIEIAKKVGKSREYVSNSLRLLMLPETILQALTEGRISEGHARPLMMLNDRGEEQETLFREIQTRKITVREAETIARRIARDKVRKKTREFDPEIVEMEERLIERLGTRVRIEPREVGGKILIDFFDDDDLRKLLATVTAQIEAHYTNTPGRDEQVASSGSDDREGVFAMQRQEPAFSQNAYGDLGVQEDLDRHEVTMEEVLEKMRPESHLSEYGGAPMDTSDRIDTQMIARDDLSDFDALIEGRPHVDEVTHVHREYANGGVHVQSDQVFIPEAPEPANAAGYPVEHRAYVSQFDVVDESPVQVRDERHQKGRRDDSDDDLYYVRNFSV